MTKRDFTTGDVSRICGVASRTVSKWCDSGRLKSYRIGVTDSNGHRRITEEDLLSFLNAHNMAIPKELQSAQAVMKANVPADSLVFFMDENKVWCCVRIGFTNLQERPAGFGITFKEAYDNLLYNEREALLKPRQTQESAHG